MDPYLSEPPPKKDFIHEKRGVFQEVFEINRNNPK